MGRHQPSSSHQDAPAPTFWFYIAAEPALDRSGYTAGSLVVMQSGRVIHEETRVLAHQGTVAGHLDASGLAL